MGRRCLSSNFVWLMQVLRCTDAQEPLYCLHFKKIMKKLLLFLILAMTITCQSKELPPIAGFESYVWQRDKYGCGSERLVMVDTLIAQRDKLLQLTEKEVIRLLGQPDARDLYVRNQKFLIYLLEPNKRCTAPEDVPVEAKALHVRLNALGKSNELYISVF